MLFINSTTHDRRYQHNSFNRIFYANAIVPADTLDIRYNSYYFAGVASNHIYLGNNTAPTHLLMANTSLKGTQHVQLEVENIAFKSILVKVDSPDFYLMDGTMPFIYSGKVGDWHASRCTFDSTYFIEAIPVAHKSFILRAMGTQFYKNVLAKKTVSPSQLKYADNLLEKQVNGIFCTDGMLIYNKHLAKLVYVYFYRNQFMCIDTSLNLLYKANTIDTISKAQIKVANVTSSNTLTMAAPPLVVNKKCSVFGNWLFINSNLLAGNEDRRIFDRSAVIDVYNLQEGRYKFSFYIPDHMEKKINSFLVSDHTLVALNDHYLLSYKLNEALFSDESSR
ncbi:hypothetical protein QQ020_07195 [Fulvivirgaceae bacterium BMA12]|uniref:Uncharacterized protein n=1 Tax=Agaribacillus aureus TaxID=3051825 RepID=A0ABT8L293_9BACT|nr:hypothetical protein [Fulvivirgaceae bacterium BMA12]